MAREILIYEQIGYNWWTGGGVTAKSFLRDLKKAEESGEEIHVRINSPGGNVFDGIAIFNAIGRSKSTVHTFNDGYAYSMAAVIMMAGKKRFAAKNSTLLLHCASGGVYGNAQDMDQSSEMLKALDTSLIASMVEFTGLSEDEVKSKWFDYKDHTLTAQQSLDEKLITELIDNKNEDIEPNASHKDVFAYFNNMAVQASKEPEGFFKKAMAIFSKNTTTPKSVLKITNKKSDMKFTSAEIAALKGGSMDSDVQKAILNKMEALSGDNQLHTQAELDTAVKAASDTITDKLPKYKEWVAKADVQPTKPKGEIDPNLTEGGEKDPLEEYAETEGKENIASLGNLLS